MSTILIVEDEKPIRDMLQFSLSREKYKIIEAGDGQEALEQLAQHKVDLILLDWMLPDIEGPKLIKKIRKQEQLKDTAILMLTAKTQEDDKITGLDYGADDYMTKPASIKELHARIRALLRRSQGHAADEALVRGNISLDMKKHLLHVDSNPVDIGGAELRLLHFFMKRPEQVFSRGQILDKVWGQNTYIEERTVDVHILRLRKILKPHGVDHLIKTVRGAGYRFIKE